jgi:anti-anti-sigma regulatory factor
METLIIQGNFTTEVALNWKKKLNTLAQKESKLVLNLKDVQEADIVGVNAIVSTHKLMADRKARLEIKIRKGSSLHNILHLTKFNSILAVSISE